MSKTLDIMNRTSTSLPTSAPRRVAVEPKIETPPVEAPPVKEEKPKEVIEEKPKENEEIEEEEELEEEDNEEDSDDEEPEIKPHEIQDETVRKQVQSEIRKRLQQQDIKQKIRDGAIRKTTIEKVEQKVSEMQQPLVVNVYIDNKPAKRRRIDISRNTDGTLSSATVTDLSDNDEKG